MLRGVNRLVDLVGPRASGLTGANLDAVTTAVDRVDLASLAATDGHFATTIPTDTEQGHTVRMARTLGLPLRYFVAKMFHGPFLLVSDRIDTLYEWCRNEKIGWQFDPLYTRMVPAHYVVEIDQSIHSP